MFSIEEFIIAVFCCVDDLLTEIVQEHPIRRKGFAPALRDSEVLTMEIVAEYQGIDSDCGIWQYFHRHWQALFPGLKSRTTFARQAANLWQYKALVQQRLAQALGGFSADVHLIDGLPLPVCGFSRAPQCQRFQGEATYGYCAAKKQTYYGFHGHLLVSADGVITGFTLTPANGSEREALWELVPQIRGLLIGDKGYLSTTLRQELRSVGITLETPLRSNMKDERAPTQLRLLQRVRRLVETVIGQLVERLHFEQVRARDLWHLTSRLNRKLLTHTVCRWLNRNSADPLQFNTLIAS